MLKELISRGNVAAYEVNGCRVIKPEKTDEITEFTSYCTDVICLKSCRLCWNSVRI